MYFQPPMLKSDNIYRKAIIEKRLFSHVRLSWIISHVRLSFLSVLEISIKHYTLYNKNNSLPISSNVFTSAKKCRRDRLFSLFTSAITSAIAECRREFQGLWVENVTKPGIQYSSSTSEIVASQEVKNISQRIPNYILFHKCKFFFVPCTMNRKISFRIFDND